MLTHRTSRSAAFWALAALALVTQVITAAITIRLTTMPLRYSNIASTAIAASTFSVFAFVLLLIVLGTRRLPQDRKSQMIVASTSAIVAVVAAILSIYTFIWTLLHRPRTDAHDLAAGGVAIWCTAILSQSGYYVYLLWPQRQVHSVEAPTEEVTIQRPSPIRTVTRSLSIHLASLTPTPPKKNWRAEPYSPTDSGYATSPNASLRRSLSQAIRPVGSRTRLIRRHSGPESLYSEAMRQEDGFETWDTSYVEDEYIATTPTRRRSARRLDPIPGSRPVSPAKPLDGPFPGGDAPEDTPLPESPRESFASVRSDEGSVDDLPPLRAPSSSTVNHIHPLFRPESPMPAPMPSPGTVITASPYAGQVIGKEHALSPRHFYANGSRSGSVKSFRTLPGTPTSEAVPLPTPPLPTTPLPTAAIPPLPPLPAAAIPPLTSQKPEVLKDEKSSTEAK
ncbi:hypothetical protein B0A50_08323 [Salinomyces thailandicus]|uniref:Uncharacterized protein n=1 Tax=Salinomyces thailandicus TaxID=706561 RepID=A0A4U0TK21_9PEZI|nr:hypothetical protein B0A50_08323 [Salinomyces thailandica]